MDKRCERDLASANGLHRRAWENIRRSRPRARIRRMLLSKLGAIARLQKDPDWLLERERDLPLFRRGGRGFVG